ncbi:hypothetical protein ACHAXR_004236 [Thalassiosira sp. AJA248-18]
MLQSYCAHLGGTANRDGSHYDNSWEENFAALLLYEQEHGDCLVPRCTQLGNWVNDQRKIAKAGKMPDERKESLVSIGFDFDPHATRWNENFAALVLYEQEHGDCLVPYSKDPQLWFWVNKQRVKAKAGKLSDERRERLESIGFSFGVKP